MSQSGKQRNGCTYTQKHKHDKETKNGGTRNETIWGATMVKTLSCLPVYSDVNGFCLFVYLIPAYLVSLSQCKKP